MSEKRGFLVRYVRHGASDQFDYIETSEDLAAEFAQAQPGMRWYDKDSGVAIDFDFMQGVYPVADYREAQRIAERFNATVTARGVEIRD